LPSATESQEFERELCGLQALAKSQELELFCLRDRNEALAKDLGGAIESREKVQDILNRLGQQRKALEGKRELRKQAAKQAAEELVAPIEGLCARPRRSWRRGIRLPRRALLAHLRPKRPWQWRHWEARSGEGQRRGGSRCHSGGGAASRGICRCRPGTVVGQTPGGHLSLLVAGHGPRVAEHGGRGITGGGGRHIAQVGLLFVGSGRLGLQNHQGRCFALLWRWSQCLAEAKALLREMSKV